MILTAKLVSADGYTGWCPYIASKMWLLVRQQAAQVGISQDKNRIADLNSLNSLSLPPSCNRAGLESESESASTGQPCLTESLAGIATGSRVGQVRLTSVLV